MLSHLCFLAVVHDQAHVELQELLMHERQFLGSAILVILQVITGLQPSRNCRTLQRSGECGMLLRQDRRCAREALDVPLDVPRWYHHLAAIDIAGPLLVLKRCRRRRRRLR